MTDTLPNGKEKTEMEEMLETHKITQEELLAQELTEKGRMAEDLYISGRKQQTIKINVEKIKQLKELIIKKQKGVILKIEDFNKIFEADLTSDVIENNSKFYAFKNKIYRITKDSKGRGIWMAKDNIEGYIKIGLK